MDELFYPQGRLIAFVSLKRYLSWGLVSISELVPGSTEWQGATDSYAASPMHPLCFTLPICIIE